LDDETGLHYNRYRYCDPVGRLLLAHSRLGRETFAFDPAGNIGNPSDTDADTQAAGRVTTRVAVRLNGDGRSMAGRLMVEGCALSFR
jgi:YD repeat-containing protein